MKNDEGSIGFYLVALMAFFVLAGMFLVLESHSPYTIPVIFKKINVIKLILKYLPFLELIVWVVFLIWAFN